MTQIELTRAPGHRRLYSLGNIGTVRLEGLFSSRATGQADGHTWRFASTGFWQRTMEATDAE